MTNEPGSQPGTTNTNVAANQTQIFTQGAAVSSTQGHNQQARLPPNSYEQIQAAFNSDGVIPSLNALRQNNTISQSVNQIITSSEQQAFQDATQGKTNNRKSGRFNTTETVTNPLQLR